MTSPWHLLLLFFLMNLARRRLWGRAKSAAGILAGRACKHLRIPSEEFKHVLSDDRCPESGLHKTCNDNKLQKLRMVCRWFLVISAKCSVTTANHSVTPADCCIEPINPLRGWGIGRGHWVIGRGQRVIARCQWAIGRCHCESGRDHLAIGRCHWGMVRCH